MTSPVSRGRPERGVLGLLRAVALILVLAGAAGSLALMLRAGRHTPGLLLVAFVFWTLSPFVVLAWATVVSKRWSDAIRVTLYVITLVLTLGLPGCIR